MRGTMITLLASGISLLVSAATRNRNMMEMWPQIMQVFRPRRKNNWRMPTFLALGIGALYLLSRYRNIGLANMGINLEKWQMIQPFTNFMRNRAIQADTKQEFQYDGQATSEEKPIEH